MSTPYYRAFNLDDAKNGAPYKTRDGQTVTVIEWDGKNEHWPILAYYGTSNKVGQWNIKGSCLNDTSCIGPLVLVMVPLGFIDGDPVYTGDTIGSGKVILKADPKMRDFSACHWPTPGEVAAPKEKPLSDDSHSLVQVYDVLGVSSHAGALHVIGHLRSEIRRLSEVKQKLEAALDDTLKERDHNCDMADSLADAISNYFCEDIGEHSNVNCPWKEALATVEDASGKMFVAESVVLDVAAGVFEEALQFIVATMSKSQVHISHGANIKEMMADAFATLRRSQVTEKAQETESETKNPAGFGHG